MIASFTLTARDLSSVDDVGERRVLPGGYTFFVGGQQPDARSAELTGQRCAEVSWRFDGAPIPLPA